MFIFAPSELAGQSLNTDVPPYCQKTGVGLTKVPCQNPTHGSFKPTGSPLLSPIVTVAAIVPEGSPDASQSPLVLPLVLLRASVKQAFRRTSSVEPAYISECDVPLITFTP